MTITLEYQDRTGLLPEHQAVRSVLYDLVLSDGARALFEQEGASIEDKDGRSTVWPGTKMPSGLVATGFFGENNRFYPAVRLADEKMENELEDHDFWSQVDLTPCPICGAPIVWYEAGYVPGYRVCAKPPHHHLLVK